MEDQRGKLGQLIDDNARCSRYCVLWFHYPICSKTNATTYFTLSSLLSLRALALSSFKHFVSAILFEILIFGILLLNVSFIFLFFKMGLTLINVLLITIAMSLLYLSKQLFHFISTSASFKMFLM